MKIALPRNLEDCVAELVQTANYQGSDEVVSEALREHQARRQGMEVVMTPELERLLDEGLEHLDQSQTTDELRQETIMVVRVLHAAQDWTRFFSPSKNPSA